MSHYPLSNTAPVNFDATASSGSSWQVARYDHTHKLVATAPLSWTSGTGTLNMTQATTSSDGWLSSDDWNDFYEASRFYLTTTYVIFLNGVTGTNFTATVNGNGSAIANIASTLQYPTLRLGTGTSTTGRAGILTTGSLFYFGGIETQIDMVIKIPTLSVTGQVYSLRLGYINILTGDPTNGVYFEYDSTASTFWRYCTANSSTRTKQTSATTVTAGTWVKLSILVNSAGNLATFYINDVSVGTINLNIPVTAGNETGIGVALISATGTTAKYAYITSVKYRFGV